MKCNALCLGSVVTMLAATLAIVPAALGTVPAFPGAVGEGMYTSGGRGGEVYHVTTLADSGPGSLRSGMMSGSSAVPRTIVFDVGGTIALNTFVQTTRDNLTIAGQTAPGQGILISNLGVLLTSNNNVLRHVRFRPGDAVKGPGSEGNFDGDTLSLWGSQMVVDHCSVSWGMDENLSCAAPAFQNITLSNNMICEGLDQTGLYHNEWNAAFNPGGTGHHGYGSLIKPIQDADSLPDQTAKITLYGNLWHNMYDRCPAVGSYDTEQTIRVDVVNNVMAGNAKNGYTSGVSDWVEMNYVGNYVIAGPDTMSTWSGRAYNAGNVGATRIYQSGNLVDADRDGVRDGVDTGWSMFSGTYTQLTEAADLLPVNVMTADEAYQNVLDDCGAFPWNRDSCDLRYIQEVISDTGMVIDSQSEVGGYPTLLEASRDGSFDTDGDGMPDAWEDWYGTAAGTPDQNGIGAYGYTHLERYLEWILDPNGVSPIPEPCTMLLVTLGAFGLLRRRR